MITRNMPNIRHAGRLTKTSKETVLAINARFSKVQFNKEFTDEEKSTIRWCMEQIKIEILERTRKVKTMKEIFAQFVTPKKLKELFPPKDGQ